MQDPIQGPDDGRSSRDQELDLLSQAYVLGELTDAEEQRFEDRLALDQDAREALVRASRLIDACEPATPSTAGAETAGLSSDSISSSPEQRSTGPRLASQLTIFAGFAAAAGLLVWLALGFLSESPTGTDPAKSRIASESGGSESGGNESGGNESGGRDSGPQTDEPDPLSAEVGLDDEELLLASWLDFDDLDEASLEATLELASDDESFSVTPSWLMSAFETTKETR